MCSNGLTEREFDEELEIQFKDVANFCRGKGHNPLGKNRMQDNPEYVFQYDIPSWLDDKLGKKLEEFKFPHNQKIMFGFSKSQFNTVQDALDRYPDTMSGKGLALKSISMKDLWRKPILA